jgi:glycosyltransferase involved in cell wall biosynthesis
METQRNKYMKILYMNGGPVFDCSTMNHLKSLGYETTFYDPEKVSKEEANKWTMAHFQMYENILKDAKNYDVLYFDFTLHTPEILLFELQTRSNLKTKIIFTFMGRESFRSKARALAIKELIDMPQIYKAIYITAYIQGSVYPPNLLDVNINKNKIHVVNMGFEGIINKENYCVDKNFSRKYFDLNQNDFVALLSGSLNYSKGVDIFIESLKYIDKNIKVVMHTSDVYGRDLDYTETFNKAKELHPNILLVRKHLNDKEQAFLYAASDVVICPHRKFYAYGHSSTLGMSGLTNRLIVAPNFFPFNEIIKQFKTGVLYEPENPHDLAMTLHFIKNNYNYIIVSAKFKESIQNYGFNHEHSVPILKEIESTL